MTQQEKDLYTLKGIMKELPEDELKVVESFIEEARELIKNNALGVIGLGYVVLEESIRLIKEKDDQRN